MFINNTFQTNQADAFIKVARSVRRKIAVFLLEKFFAGETSTGESEEISTEKISTEENEDQIKTAAENEHGSVEGISLKHFYVFS